MEFFEAVKKRRSVRVFKDQPLPEGVVDRALDAALIAPNSSNMQPWEFYRVRSLEKRQELVEACFSQPAAKTAAELIVAVCRIDTWRRNQALMLEHLSTLGKAGVGPSNYYKKVVPLVYLHDPLGLLGIFKYLFFTLLGFFKPSPRGPVAREQLFSMLAKSTALACENFMLAMTAQGFATCPMEGFDEQRVKKILGLKRSSRIVMIMAAGVADPKGIYADQHRFERNLFVFDV